MGESEKIESPESAYPVPKSKKRQSPDVGTYMTPKIKKEIEESDAQRLAELQEKLGRKSIKEKGGEKKA